MNQKKEDENGDGDMWIKQMKIKMMILKKNKLNAFNDDYCVYFGIFYLPFGTFYL
jgi:hypothetical protein